MYTRKLLTTDDFNSHSDTVVWDPDVDTKEAFSWNLANLWYVQNVFLTFIRSGVFCAASLRRSSAFIFKTSRRVCKQYFLPKKLSSLRYTRPHLYLVLPVNFIRS